MSETKGGDGLWGLGVSIDKSEIDAATAPRKHQPASVHAEAEVIEPDTPYVETGFDRGPETEVGYPEYPADVHVPEDIRDINDLHQETLLMTDKPHEELMDSRGSILEEDAPRKKKSGSSSMIIIIAVGFFMLLLLGGAGLLVVKKIQNSKQHQQVLEEEVTPQYIQQQTSQDAIPVVQQPEPAASELMESASGPVSQLPTQNAQAPAVVPGQTAPAPFNAAPQNPVQNAPTVPVQAPVSDAAEERLRGDLRDVNLRLDDVVKRIDTLQRQMDSALDKIKDGARMKDTSAAPKVASVSSDKPKEAPAKPVRKPVPAKPVVAVTKPLPVAPIRPGMSAAAVQPPVAASKPAAESAVTPEVAPVKPVVQVQEKPISYALTGVIGQRAWVVKRSGDGRETEISVTVGDKVDGVSVSEINDKERRVMLSNGIVISSGSTRR